MIATLLWGFIILLFFGVPLAISTGVATIIPALLDPSFPATGSYVVRAIFSGADSTPILAVPLFMLSGALMTSGGISKRLFNVFAYIAGKKTGGIPCAVVLTCLFFGAVCGSGPATTAAVASMTLPVLLKLGYDRGWSCSIVAAAGGLGIIIPPSANFVVYGLVTGTSIGDLFMAGIIPGVLIAACMMLYIYLYCKFKGGEDKEKIAENYNELKKKGFGRVCLDSFWALLTPVIILGSIYSGIATPTEAAVISVIYALVVSLFAYRTMKFKDIFPVLKDAVTSCAPICLILAIATAFGQVLTLLKVPTLLNTFIMANFSSRVGVLLMFCAIIFIMGMFMDCAPAQVILAPMLLPTLVQLGVDPVHFGIILTVGMAIGFVTPPFGLNLFVAAPYVKLPPTALYKPTMPFIFTFITVWLIITFVPQISLCLI